MNRDTSQEQVEINLLKLAKIGSLIVLLTGLSLWLVIDRTFSLELTLILAVILGAAMGLFGGYHPLGGESVLLYLFLGFVLGWGLGLKLLMGLIAGCFIGLLEGMVLRYYHLWQLYWAGRLSEKPLFINTHKVLWRRFA